VAWELRGGCTDWGSAVSWELTSSGRWAGSEPGGLASSVVDGEGFALGLGGHVLFSHYQYYTDYISDLGSALCCAMYAR
jgi:hypothetical protein